MRWEKRSCPRTKAGAAQVVKSHVQRPTYYPLTVALADRHQPTKEDHHETTSS